MFSGMFRGTSWKTWELWVFQRKHVLKVLNTMLGSKDCKKFDETEETKENRCPGYRQQQTLEEVHTFPTDTW